MFYVPSFMFFLHFKQLCCAVAQLHDYNGGCVVVISDMALLQITLQWTLDNFTNHLPPP